MYWNRCHKEVPLFLLETMLSQHWGKLHSCRSSIGNRFLASLSCHKFLVPEETGCDYEESVNLDWIIENTCYSAIYVPPSKLNNLMETFRGDCTVVLDLSSTTLRDFESKV
jgi:hypothetical protein